MHELYNHCGRQTGCVPDPNLVPSLLFTAETADLIIAADSGARHLKGSGYLPHVIVGDMDSIDPDTLEFFQTNNVLIQSHPRRKTRPTWNCAWLTQKSMVPNK